jgi:hypothetical protein
MIHSASKLIYHEKLVNGNNTLKKSDFLICRQLTNTIMLISLTESFYCLAFETAMFVIMENVNNYLPDCEASRSKREFP